MKKLIILILTLVTLPSCTYFSSEKEGNNITQINIPDSKLQAVLNEIRVLKGNLTAQEEIIRLQYAMFSNTASNSDFHRLGNLFVFKGWYEQGELVYKNLLNKKDEKVKALNGLGVLEFRRNNMTPSLDYFYTALKESPEDLDTLNNMGIWHFKNGNLDSAKGFLQKIIKIQPNHSEANANLGSIYHSLEEYGKAIEYFKTALETNGKPVGPRMLLAESYGNSNQLKKAEKEYRYILAMDSGNILAAEGLNRLQKNKET